MPDVVAESPSAVRGRRPPPPMMPSATADPAKRAQQDAQKRSAAARARKGRGAPRRCSARPPVSARSSRSRDRLIGVAVFAPLGLSVEAGLNRSSRRVDVVGALSRVLSWSWGRPHACAACRHGRSNSLARAPCGTSPGPAVGELPHRQRVLRSPMLASAATSASSSLHRSMAPVRVGGQVFGPTSPSWRVAAMARRRFHAQRSVAHLPPSLHEELTRARPRRRRLCRRRKREKNNMSRTWRRERDEGTKARSRTTTVTTSTQTRRKTRSRTRTPRVGI